MECPHIQERLSEYIDGRLSPQEKASVDEHLRSCTECTAALDDLKKTVGYMKDLGTVEPPAWLTQKVMEKIRAEARPKEGLFRKLFYPLHVKLPIEAVATVLVVGLALYIYRDISPEVKLAKAPTEEAAPQITQREIIREDKVGPLTKSEEKKAPQEVTAAPEKPMEQPPVQREGEMKAEELAKPNVQEPERRAEVKVPAPVKSLEQAPAAGAAAKDEARQETRAGAPKAKMSHMEKQEEKALSVTVLVKDPAAAAGEVEKILKKFEGRMIHTESLEGKKVITATMTAGNARQLVEKLKVIGDIEEKELDLKGREGDMIVRIEVIKNP